MLRHISTRLIYQLLQETKPDESFPTTDCLPTKRQTTNSRRSVNLKTPLKKLPLNSPLNEKKKKTDKARQKPLHQINENAFGVKHGPCPESLNRLGFVNPILKSKLVSFV